MRKRNIFLCIPILLSMGIVGTMLTAQSTDTAQESKEATGERQHAWLGIRGSEISPALKAHMSVLREQGGVMVQEVVDDSPAQLAGLQPFDVITAFNDSAVDSPNRLIELVRQAKPGDQVTIRYLRDGRESNIDVTLEALQTAMSSLVMADNLTDRFAMVPPTNRLQPFVGHPFTVQPFNGQPFAGQPFGFSFVWPSPSVYTMDIPQTGWSNSQSIRIVQNGDDRVSVEVEYQQDGESISRKFEGKRDEVLESLKSDDALPEELRKSIEKGLTNPSTSLQSLTQSLRQKFRQPLWQSPFMNQQPPDNGTISWPKSFVPPGMIDDKMLDKLKGINFGGIP